MEAADRAGASRIAAAIVLGRLLWRCAFSVFTVVAGSVVLAAVPQAREALLLFAADAGEDLWRSGLYVASVLYWAATAWFAARLLLGRRFAGDSLGVPADDPFVGWVAAALPRTLAFAATLPVCVLTWHAHRVLGLVTALASAAFLVFLVLRRRLAEGDARHARRAYAGFDRLGPNGRQGVLGLPALSMVLLAGLWWLPAGLVMAALWAAATAGLYGWDQRRRPDGTTPPRPPRERIVFALHLAAALATLGSMAMQADEIALARQLGSPAILLCALAGWTVFGGLVLSYWPMTRGVPAMAMWLPPLLVLAGSLHETHFVAQRGAAPEGDDWRRARPTLVQRFGDWIARQPPGEPVFVAALVGGASRAAFWSGSVLARLEDEARLQGRAFGERMFALSSVSGGSLGAAAWVAELAQYHDLQVCPQGAAPDCRRARIEQFLGQDFLSPVFARMLFPDLAIRFVPLPLPAAWSARADRSLGLEEPWLRDWRTLPATRGSEVSWAQPISALYTRAERDGPPRLPSLLLNTVRLEDGQRFLQSNLQLALPHVLDLLDPAFDTVRLTLAQAVHNSARFPYVSPGAVLLAADDPRRVPLGRLGDGGYHEASGTATLADLLEAMQREGLLRRRPGLQGLWACGAGWAVDGKDCAQAPHPVVALVLDSEPAHYPHDHLRDLDGRPLPPRPGLAPPGMPLPELLGPAFGGLSTRTNLSRASQLRLSRLVGDDPRAFIELRMPVWRTTLDDAQAAATREFCTRRSDQPSMNWALDRCSRARLSAAADPATAFGPHPTLAQQALRAQLQRLRALIAGGAADFGRPEAR